jgi:hypothetical protein
MMGMVDVLERYCLLVGCDLLIEVLDTFCPFTSLLQ